MNKKRILAIIMSLTLAFSIVGCGKSENGVSSSTETTKEETSSDSDDEFEKIKLTEKNVFELGAKQTKEAKTILEKYGVKTAYLADRDGSSPIAFSKNENDPGVDNAKGYSIQTAGDITVNDGGSGQHKYHILLDSYKLKSDSEPTYMYQISIEYPMTEEFKIDNFKMFKELVESVQGKDYNFDSLESWMNDHMKKTRDGSKIGGSARDIGSYHEGLEGGEAKLGSKDKYLVTYIISLRK